MENLIWDDIADIVMPSFDLDATILLLLLKSYRNSQQNEIHLA